ncbi:hypothetical protein XELAEV_18042894mg [Xenopus laevis]|uniref:Uncharacterized protein n=1 Tax=Xenopus laevis TaxID=8355 RepID=A0A974C569_XENLA|nr:hypothetical protein XELAEV_18042894mg [Xenopus laevis]
MLEQDSGMDIRSDCNHGEGLWACQQHINAVSGLYRGRADERQDWRLKADKDIMAHPNGSCLPGPRMPSVIFKVSAGQAVLPLDFGSSAAPAKAVKLRNALQEAWNLKMTLLKTKKNKGNRRPQTVFAK